MLLRKASNCYNNIPEACVYVPAKNNAMYGTGGVGCCQCRTATNDCELSSPDGDGPFAHSVVAGSAARGANKGNLMGCSQRTQRSAVQRPNAVAVE